MARLSEYDKWELDGELESKLIQIEGWKRDGLTDEQIGHNLGLSETTITDYKKKYPLFLGAIKKGKEIVDFEVENALLKNALSGNVTAQIFWLKNRKKEQWREKVEYNEDEEDLQKVKDVLVAIKEVANNDK